MIPFSLKYTHNDLIEDPLVLLRCDPVVFRSPALFEMLLQILSIYLTFVKNKYMTIARNAKDTPKIQEGINALILAQESAIVQMLLEICKDDFDPLRDKRISQEIGTKVCTLIHQIFIENPLIIKIVHFQEYDKSLLPLTVYGIPSMHTCLNFIPELLSLPILKKQLFGIHLASYVIERYPIEKSLEISRNVLSHLCNTNNISQNIPFMLEALPCVVNLVRAFPSLIDETIDLFFTIAPNFKNDNTSVYVDKRLVEKVKEVFQEITLLITK